MNLAYLKQEIRLIAIIFVVFLLFFGVLHLSFKTMVKGKIYHNNPDEVEEFKNFN